MGLHFQNFGLRCFLKQGSLKTGSIPLLRRDTSFLTLHSFNTGKGDRTLIALPDTLSSKSFCFLLRSLIRQSSTFLNTVIRIKLWSPKVSQLQYNVTTSTNTRSQKVVKFLKSFTSMGAEGLWEMESTFHAGSRCLRCCAV